MMTKFRRFGAISMMVLASFSTTSLIQPQNVQAGCGVLCWPLFIVGGVFVFWGFSSASMDGGLISPFFFITGAILLDGEGNQASFKEMSDEKALAAGITKEDQELYNSNRNEMKMLMQTVWSNTQNALKEAGTTVEADLHVTQLQVGEEFSKIGDRLNRTEDQSTLKAFEVFGRWLQFELDQK